MSQIVWEEEPKPQEQAPPEEPAGGQAKAPEGAPAPQPEAPRPIPVFSTPEPASGDIPHWAIWPDGLMAPRGRAVFFARFPSNWTDTPDRGLEMQLTDEELVAWATAGVKAPTRWRQCIFWALAIGDQKIALQRANGDPNRMNSELTKQMIRSTDGQLVDRSTVGVDIWWEQLGERCRSELTRMCVRISTLSAQERALFLGHCVAARTAG